MRLIPSFCSLAILTTSLVSAADRPVKPNVVLILADDLGWQDVKCYDIDAPSPMETPHLDAFATRGVQFWQGYSPAPTCAPSRCAILSGNHPARAQKTHVVGGAPPAPINRNFRMMAPWYSGRMPENEWTLARALGQNGYVTGHVGKWHIAIEHNAFPQPGDVGFDFTRSNRGSRRSMPDRLKNFATPAVDDPYRLDENGYAYHQNSEDALHFLREHKDQPFFLYYATWLVHAPIHTRSQQRLEKYAKRLNTDPAATPGKDTPGQRNPFYCAMVEELDYYIGKLLTYLEETEDPRWPGHRLNENTFVIFTSDNGGMEGSPSERYTDNEPLAEGKISAMEGGTRVPLLIAGPGIPAGVQTEVMANGLDFYPTILSMTRSSLPEHKRLDGCDLLPLLTTDPTDPNRVRDKNGSVRDTMVWHFPHGWALESTLRVGDYKLVRNYDHVNNPDSPHLELFRLYDSTGTEPRRVDIEESNNLAETDPKRTAAMNAKLSKLLTEMEASYPYYCPSSAKPLPHADQVCDVTSHQRNGSTARFQFSEKGARVIRADLIYTTNGGEQYEEWFRAPAELTAPGEVVASLPEGTTHYFLNLIDENRFLRSYPEVVKRGKSYSASALATSATASRPKPRPARKTTDWNVPFDRFDTNQDDFLSLEEYLIGQAGGRNLEQRFRNFDKDADGKVSRSEFVNRKR